VPARSIITLLSLITFGLLVYLLFFDSRYIENTGTNNDQVIESRKAQVDALTNIDSVKLEAKRNLDIIQQGQRTRSRVANRNLRIIILILILQITRWIIFYRAVRKQPSS